MNIEPSLSPSGDGGNDAARRRLLRFLNVFLIAAFAAALLVITRDYWRSRAALELIPDTLTRETLADVNPADVSRIDLKGDEMRCIEGAEISVSDPALIQAMIASL